MDILLFSFSHSTVNFTFVVSLYVASHGETILEMSE